MLMVMSAISTILFSELLFSLFLIEGQLLNIIAEYSGFKLLSESGETEFNDIYFYKHFLLI